MCELFSLLRENPPHDSPPERGPCHFSQPYSRTRPISFLCWSTCAWPTYSLLCHTRRNLPVTGAPFFPLEQGFSVCWLPAVSKMAKLPALGTDPILARYLSPPSGEHANDAVPLCTPPPWLPCSQPSITESRVPFDSELALEGGLIFRWGRAILYHSLVLIMTYI